jgi:hypothetical protein
LEVDRITQILKRNFDSAKSEKGLFQQRITQFVSDEEK